MPVNIASKPTALLLALASAGLAAQAVCTAQAQEPFPSRSITLIVPFPPGGPPDVVVRVFGPQMAIELGKPVVIENKPGGNTAIAAVLVARAAPDGHTILASDISQAIAPHIMKNPGFDPIKDLKPIGLTTRSMQSLLVANNVPAKNIKELVALAKQKPDELKIAHSGFGGPPYLAAVAFMEAAGIKLSPLYYRGIAQGTTDVLGGHVAMLFTGPSLTAELHKAGKARVFAVTGPKRLAVMPDVPTMEESGIHFKAMKNGYAFGFTAPAGTPDAIIAKLNEAVHKAARNPELVAALAKLEINVETSTPEAYGKIIRDDHDYWRDMLKSLGIERTD